MGIQLRIRPCIGSIGCGPPLPRLAHLHAPLVRRFQRLGELVGRFQATAPAVDGVAAEAEVLGFHGCRRPATGVGSDVSATFILLLPIPPQPASE